MKTLAEFLDSRRLHLAEVRAWASAVATELSTLHEQGRAHGTVAAETVRIEGNRASLMPCRANQAQPDQVADIVQFGALLQKMLACTQVNTGAERAMWDRLDRIAITASRAAAGSRMKKVASALKLVRPPSKPAVPRRGARVLVLVREVSPTESANIRQDTWKFFHVGVFLASAASVAVVGCLMLIRLMQ